MTGNDDRPVGENSSESTILCTQCGATIDRSEWHPVIVDEGDDGEFQLYPFCDETCRDEWQ